MLAVVAVAVVAVVAVAAPLIEREFHLSSSDIQGFVRMH